MLVPVVAGDDVTSAFFDETGYVAGGNSSVSTFDVSADISYSSVSGAVDFVAGSSALVQSGVFEASSTGRIHRQVRLLVCCAPSIYTLCDLGCLYAETSRRYLRE